MEPTQTDGCHQPPRPPQIATVLAFMIACVPAVLIYWLIRENAVNVPFLDDWEFATLVEKFCQGQMTFADLYAPHIEHRMVFPRLVFLATFLWGHGSLAISIWFSFCTVLAVSWCVFRLSRPTGWPMAARWLLVGAANLALFSPIQVQNWLWMVQVCYFLPICGFYCALMAFFGVRNRWWRLFWCALPALVSTYSFAHGILVFVVLMLLMAAEFWREGKGRRQLWPALAWLGLLVLVAAAYFLNLHNEASHSHALNQDHTTPFERHVLDAFLRPGDLTLFILRFIGSPFCRGYFTHSTDFGTIVGGILIGVFFLACGYVAWHRRRLRMRNYAPWIACGLYALGLAAATGIGRIPLDDKGPGAAMTLRYTTFGLHLYVGLVFLLPMIIQQWNQSRRGLAAGPASTACPVPAGWILAVAVAWALPPWFMGEKLMAETKSARAQGLAALMFCQQIWPIDGAQIVLETDPVHLLTQATKLDNLGLLKPPLRKDKSLDGFKINQKKTLRRNTPAEGWFSIGKSPWPDQWVAEGEARMPGRKGGPADAILLTYRTPENRPEIFAVILPQPVSRLARYPRAMDFQFINRRLMSGPDFASWKGMFLRSRLPERHLRVEAWALDSLRRVLYPIEGEERVD